MIDFKKINIQWISPNDFEDFEKAEKIFKSGLKWFQYRDKNVSDDIFIQRAQKWKILCHKYDIKFIINDRIHLLNDTQADGVHLGKNDTPLSEATKFLKPNLTLGYTINEVEDMVNVKGFMDKISYFGVGPLHSTNTKTNARKPYESKEIVNFISKLRKVTSKHPIFVIGGVTDKDFGLLNNCDIQGFAMSEFLLKKVN